MKWAAALLSLWMLFLVLQPCQDSLIGECQSSHCSAGDSQDDCKENPSPSSEQCSPLCNCAVYVFQKQIHSASIPMAEKRLILGSIKKRDAEIPFIDGIFQPPKMS